LPGCRQTERFGLVFGEETDFSNLFSGLGSKFEGDKLRQRFNEACNEIRHQIHTSAKAPI
jgi:hypothetical protein